MRKRRIKEELQTKEVQDALRRKICNIWELVYENNDEGFITMQSFLMKSSALRIGTATVLYMIIYTLIATVIEFFAVIVGIITFRPKIIWDAALVYDTNMGLVTGTFKYLRYLL